MNMKWCTNFGYHHRSFSYTVQGFIHCPMTGRHFCSISSGSEKLKSEHVEKSLITNKKNLLILATLSTPTPSTITTLKPGYPLNTAFGISRHFPGLSELWVLLPPWQWAWSLLFPQNMPRRRVSVAVVPKFNILNLPGQSPSSSPIPSLPALVSMIMLASWASGSQLWGWPGWGRVNKERKFPAQILSYGFRSLSIDQASGLVLPREDSVSLSKVLAAQRAFLAKRMSFHA